jgi:hypothetical protein
MIFINNKSMNESNNEEIESTSNNQQLNIDKMTIKKYRKIAIFGFSFSIVASGLFLLGYYCFRD